MNKALVIGGSGFLGSHVADHLSDIGYNVYIYDIRKSTYLRQDQKMIIGDIDDEISLDKAIKDSKYVFHFAGLADIHESTINPLNTIKTNVLSTTLILDKCVKNKVERFMYASTIYVYSNHGSFYKTSKQCSELIIENYCSAFNLKCTIMRYGSLYGKRANFFNSIMKMIKQAIEDKKITRSGDGEEVRDYINVIDAAKASIDLINSKEMINYVMITGNQTMKIKNIVDMINEMMGNNLEIVYTNENQSEHYKITPYNFKPNVAKKYISNYSHDLGQGILESIYEMYESLKSK